MTTTPNDGGPAFPCETMEPATMHIPDGRGGFTPTMEMQLRQHTGISLRDYFAGLAFAIIAAIPVHEQADAPYLAAEAYRIADAMLAERAKNGGAQ